MNQGYLEHTLFMAAGAAAVLDALIPGETFFNSSIGVVAAIAAGSVIQDSHIRASVAYPALGLGVGYFVGRAAGQRPHVSLLLGGVVMVYMMFAYKNKAQDTKQLSNPGVF